MRRKFGAKWLRQRRGVVVGRGAGGLCFGTRAAMQESYVQRTGSGGGGGGSGGEGSKGGGLYIFCYFCALTDCLSVCYLRCVFLFFCFFSERRAGFESREGERERTQFPIN